MSEKNKHNLSSYTFPEDADKGMVSEPAVAAQYAQDLKYGMEVLSTVTPDTLHNIVMYLSNYTLQQSDVKHTNLPPYTVEELMQRNDEAFAELEAGGGKDGELFFAELKESILS